MSRILPERLRGCLEHALGANAPDGSLYLLTLACCYLAAPERAELQLAHEYYLQAEAERVDGDDVLTDLLLGVPS